jgi:UDP-glucose 4-epimerase
VRVLFTGSSGPKSAVTVASVVASRHQVLGIDLQPGPHTTLVRDIVAIDDWQPLLEGVDAVVHFAALHAPHRESHHASAFNELNVETTKRMLDASQLAGVKRFVLASTTSVYGRAMRPPSAKGNQRAVWVTERVQPEPEDIYDQTKLQAEALCRSASGNGLSAVALRFSRCFPEPQPLQTIYRLYRGVDARDVGQAVLRALEYRVGGFDVFNISGETPFVEADCDALLSDAPSVILARVPALADAFAQRGWPLPQSIDRVYVTDKAKNLLGFAAQFGWESVPASATAY